MTPAKPMPAFSNQSSVLGYYRVVACKDQVSKLKPADASDWQEVYPDYTLVNVRSPLIAKGLQNLVFKEFCEYGRAMFAYRTLQDRGFYASKNFQASRDNLKFANL